MSRLYAYGVKTCWSSGIAVEFGRLWPIQFYGLDDS